MCSRFVSPLEQRERLIGAEGDGNVDLARKVVLHLKKREPELCLCVLFHKLG